MYLTTVTKYMNKNLYNSKNGKSTIIFDDFNTPLSIIKIISIQKINKNMEELNNNINQLDINDIYRTLYLKIEHKNTQSFPIHLKYLPK